MPRLLFMNKDLHWIYIAGVASNVESSCECNTKHSFSINGREVLDQMSDLNFSIRTTV
jgi:hypothetical protein